jgi:hypothetical protein
MGDNADESGREKGVWYHRHGRWIQRAVEDDDVSKNDDTTELYQFGLSQRPSAGYHLLSLEYIVSKTSRKALE